MALLVGMAMEGGVSAGVLIDIVYAIAQWRESFPASRRNTIDDDQ